MESSQEFDEEQVSFSTAQGAVAKPSRSDGSFPPLRSLKKALPPTQSFLSPISSPSTKTTTNEVTRSGGNGIETVDESEEESEGEETEEEEEEDKLVNPLLAARIDALEERLLEAQREVLACQDVTDLAVRKSDECMATVATSTIKLNKQAERITEVELARREYVEQVTLLTRQLKKERAQFKQRTGVMQARIKFLEEELEKALSEE